MLLKKIADHAFTWFFLLVCILILICLFPLPSGGASLVFSIILFAVFALFLYVLHRLEQAGLLRREKVFYGVTAISLLCVLAIQLYVCSANVYRPYKGDYEAIYTAVKELVSYGRFTDTEWYYLAHPHQLFSTVLLAILNRAFVMLGSSQAVNILYTSYTISLFTTLGLLCIVLSAKLWFGTKTAYIVLLLLLLDPSYYGCNIYLYPHALSTGMLGLTLLCFALALKSAPHKKRSLCLMVIAGCAFAAAKSLEGILTIGFVAAIIYIFMTFDLKHALLNNCALVLGFLLMLFAIGGVYHVLDIFNTPQRAGKELPVEHWIMMGLSEDGLYKEEDFQRSIQLPDTQARRETARQEIAERLRSRSSSQLLHLFRLKEKRAWVGMPYGVQVLGANTWPAHNALTLLLMLGLLLSALQRLNGSRHASMWLQIWVTGLFLFFLLWESSSTYLFSSKGMIILLAGTAFGSLFRRPPSTA